MNNNIPGIFLVTRPEEKSLDFIRALSSAGVQTRSLPMISIEPIKILSDNEAIEKKFLTLLNCDLVIFISSYAVNILDNFLKILDLGWPNKLKCIAIGSQTAKSVQDKGWSLYNKSIFNDSNHQQTSESLLSLPPLKEALNKNIIIVRGVGGREFLSDILKKRGANVEYFELYNRISKSYELKELTDSLGIEPEKSEVSAILFASGETLQSFYENIQKYKLFNKVKKIQLIVPSERIRKIALNLGFLYVKCTINASHSAFLDEILSMPNMRKVK